MGFDIPPYMWDIKSHLICGISGEIPPYMWDILKKNIYYIKSAILKDFFCVQDLHPRLFSQKNIPPYMWDLKSHLICGISPEIPPYMWDFDFVNTLEKRFLPAFLGIPGREWKTLFPTYKVGYPPISHLICGIYYFDWYPTLYVGYFWAAIFTLLI